MLLMADVVHGGKRKIYPRNST